MFIFHGEIIDYNFFKANKTDNCILFLHGWGGNKNSFASTINLLKTKYNCLSITLPTIEPTSLVWDMPLYVDCVLNLIETLNTKNIMIVCHSFGFRIATLLKYKIKINKMIVTGGAGAKKLNFFKKIDKINNICLLKAYKNKIFLKNSTCIRRSNLDEKHQEKYNDFYESLCSADYKTLSKTNKKTFKNVVNFNTINLLKFNFPLLLFWGKFDTETPVWIAKYLKKLNPTAELILTPEDHFAYIKENMYFNNLVVKFLK